MKALRTYSAAVALLLAACSTDPADPPAPADAQALADGGGVAVDSGGPGTPDASPLALDAGQPLPDSGQVAPDGGAEVEPDAGAVLPDASGPGADAAEPPDAAEPGADASASLPDAGPGATVQIASANDALSSYLINVSPSAWNIFYGANVHLGRHFDTAHVSYHTALRFPGLQIPKGATIVSAKVFLWPTNSIDSTKNLYINIYAEKAADSAPFNPTNYDSGRPDQRAHTTAHFDHWTVRCNGSCSTDTEYDCAQRKLDCWDPATEYACPKDLKALVQEVIDLPGWAPGNALTLLFINAATDQDGAKYQSARTFTGYDTARGASFSPRLVVTWAP